MNSECARFKDKVEALIQKLDMATPIDAKVEIMATLETTGLGLGLKQAELVDERKPNTKRKLGL